MACWSCCCGCEGRAATVTVTVTLAGVTASVGIAPPALGPCRRHLSVESCLMRGVGRDAAVRVYWGLAIWGTLVGDAAVIDAHESHLRPSDACYA